VAIADDLRLSYRDPALWNRLGPRVAAHAAETSEGILTHKAKTYEDYRDQLGYLRALRWVIAEAREMQRADDDGRPMGEDC
jgi:hypothetical protein